MMTSRFSTSQATSSAARILLGCYSNRPLSSGRFPDVKMLLVSIALGMALLSADLPAAELQEVATFPTQQVTGVAVSKTGRIFVNFPDWSDDHTISVAELVNGQAKPFPNDELNKPG